jgi:hypothetical protein
MSNMDERYHQNYHCTQWGKVMADKVKRTGQIHTWSPVSVECKVLLPGSLECLQNMANIMKYVYNRRLQKAKTSFIHFYFFAFTHYCIMQATTKITYP